MLKLADCDEQINGDIEAAMTPRSMQKTVITTLTPTTMIEDTYRKDIL